MQTSLLLSDDDLAAIHAQVDAMPPLTDDDLDHLASAIVASRERQRESAALPA
jgi:hypothetical protein